MSQKCSMATALLPLHFSAQRRQAMSSAHIQSLHGCPYSQAVVARCDEIGRGDVRSHPFQDLGGLLDVADEGQDGHVLLQGHLGNAFEAGNQGIKLRVDQAAAPQPAARQVVEFLDGSCHLLP